ncbi:hypothetical protein [Mycolicibacterium neworleansense]|uniref:PknH-like extracellular domain-containing protein n=1 Tax=Mycolicibacterium neworleansense TaxID=146018 RepID=A0A0H5RTP8_9MYCO|nr:hypothetical protein [Mycolicibacterium neworleansense]MCV7361534.1 hypothetical protein [Mycolicibacterium neworleansense]CRZ16887.1 hypothetical protein BN2156_03765 [Mycolicibacterium neworleansense]
MSGPNGMPDQWSYSAPPGATSPRKLSRRTIILGSVGIGVAVVLVAALVAWLAWPRSAPIEHADAPEKGRPLLSDKPPTMILNAIDFDSLYPPGYTEFDYTKMNQSGGSGYDPDREYKFTSEPQGCTSDDDPLYTAKWDFGGDDDPERYKDARISRLMYPVDDPGGNKEDSKSFSLTVFPSKEPTSLDFARQWYERCKGAKITTVISKHGQVIETKTRSLDHVVIAAPESAADDSFALTSTEREECDYYGLVRGMIVNVTCPPEQKDAGAQLFRKVVIGLQEV